MTKIGHNIMADYWPSDQGIFTIQSAGGIFPPALLLAPPALWWLLMLHQCFALFSYGPLRTSNMSEAMPRKNLRERSSLRVDT